ncbi:MAG: IS3 family transposase [Agathobaculum desmolans]|uniref:IS3 family transposase n=1 Tax=Agathobaculum desmolans TaxID=39484 RepID=UPI00399308AA
MRCWSRHCDRRSSFETFAKAVDTYINYYNNERIQAKTKWMPPAKFRGASMCT